jgi:hypothetical protein
MTKINDIKKGQWYQAKDKSHIINIVKVMTGVSRLFLPELLSADELLEIAEYDYIYFKINSNNTQISGPDDRIKPKDFFRKYELITDKKILLIQKKLIKETSVFKSDQKKIEIKVKSLKQSIINSMKKGGISVRQVKESSMIINELCENYQNDLMSNSRARFIIKEKQYQSKINQSKKQKKN